MDHCDDGEQPPELALAQATETGRQCSTVDRSWPTVRQREVWRPAFVRHLLGQVVCRLQERAAAASGDVVLVGDTVDAAVVGEEVRVAGQEQRHLRTARQHEASEQLPDAKVLLFPLLAQLPQRHRGAQDDLIALAELRGSLREVRALWLVERVVEGCVDAPDPPAVRQLDDPPPFALRGLPVPGKGVRVHDQVVEQRDAAVPVVVAGDGHHCGVLGGQGVAVQLRPGGQAVGEVELLLVLVASGVRIDLVAAHDQEATPRQCGRRSWQLVVTVDGQRDAGSGELPRHRQRGIDRVAEVTDVVEPERAVVAGG